MLPSTVFNLWIGPGFIFEPCGYFVTSQEPFSCYYPWTRSVFRCIS